MNASARGNGYGRGYNDYNSYNGYGYAPYGYAPYGYAAPALTEEQQQAMAEQQQAATSNKNVPDTGAFFLPGRNRQRKTR